MKTHNSNPIQAGIKRIWRTVPYNFLSLYQITCCCGLIFLMLLSVSGNGQVERSRLYSIQPKGINKVLTIKYASKHDNAPAVLLKLQHTDDQRFQLSSVNNKLYPAHYRIKSRHVFSNNPGLTVYTQQSNAQGKASSSSQLGSKVVQYRFLKYDPYAKYKLGVNYTHQSWKIEKVPGEKDTYWIKSLAFGDKRVFTRINTNDWSTIHLEPFDSKDERQKWIMKLAMIDGSQPENVKINHFELNKSSSHAKSGTLSGNLTWTDHTKYEKGFKIWMKGPGSSQFTPIGNVSANKTKFSFSFKAKVKSNNQYKFYVVAYHEWKSDHRRSATVVGSPKIISPKPPAAKGTQKIIVYNCHNNRKRVRLYLKDLTVGNTWQQVGYLNSGKNSSGGCNKNNPKSIPLKDGHQYILKALDCGSSNPNQTDSRCHRMTTSVILGDSDGYNSVEYVVY